MSAGERGQTSLYLDSCCVIYLFEGTQATREVFARRIALHRSEPRARLLTSRLSLLECRVKPLREGNLPLVEMYERFFGSADIEVTDISVDVIERATGLRAKQGFKTPDALHLASAMSHGAKVFLTGDARLAKCDGLNVECLAVE